MVELHPGDEKADVGMAAVHVRRNALANLACAVRLFTASLDLDVSSLSAQVSRAQINGIVGDSTGAAVPEAVVLLRNTATGVETRTATNEQGVYVILNILPGTYTVEASKEGFTTSRVEPFTLVVNQASVFDFQLP